MFLTKEYVECPFCKKGLIELLHRPKTVQIKRTYGAGSGTIPRTSSEKWLVLGDSCVECGKTNSEITNKLKEKGII